MRVRWVLTGLMVVAAGTWAHADVIYDNGVPQGGQTTVSDYDFPYQLAADFHVSEGSNLLTDVHWWGAYRLDNSPGDDSFTVRIYADTGGHPDGAALLEYTGISGNRVDTGENLGASDVDLYSYSLDVAPTLLASGTAYWLSIVNDTSSDANDDWFWASTSIAGGNTAYRQSDGGAWAHFDAGGDLPNGVEMAFYLTGVGPVVPEPASLTMLVLGLAALGSRVRRG